MDRLEQFYRKIILQGFFAAIIVQEMPSNKDTNGDQMIKSSYGICQTHGEYDIGYCEPCVQDAKDQRELNLHNWIKVVQAAKQHFVCEHGTGSQGCNCFARTISENMETK
jgi:hypothetical protein